MSDQILVASREPSPPTQSKPTPEQVAEALELIQSVDWAAYWRRVDQKVAREVDAYAASRAKSLQELGHCVLR